MDSILDNNHYTCDSTHVSTYQYTTAGELIKCLTLHNTLQLIDKQSFMWSQLNMSRDEY